MAILTLGQRRLAPGDRSLGVWPRRRRRRYYMASHKHTPTLVKISPRVINRDNVNGQVELFVHRR